MLNKIRSLPIVVAVLSAIMIVTAWVWAFYSLRGIQEPLILHWSSFTGITQIGRMSELSEIAIVSLIIIIINGLLGAELEKRSVFLSKLTVFASAVFALLIFISFMAIIAVN